MDYDGYEEQNKVQFYRYEEVKNEKYNNVPAEAYELQLWTVFKLGTSTLTIPVLGCSTKITGTYLDKAFTLV